MKTLRFLPIWVFFLFSPAAAQGDGGSHDPFPLTTLIIVRHAEKDTSGDDPSLTETGRARARRLAEMLSGTTLDALIASPRRRTQETLAPLADRIGLPLTIIPLDGSVGTHVAALLDTVLGRYAGRTVLVASHSNVIPVFLGRLGVTEPVTIGDDEYDDMFIVTRSGTGNGTPSMIRLTFTVN